MMAKAILFDRLTDMEQTWPRIDGVTELINKNTVAEAVQLADFCASAAKRLQDHGHCELAEVYKGVAMELINMLLSVHGRILAADASTQHATVGND